MKHIRNRAERIIQKRRTAEHWVAQDKTVVYIWRLIGVTQPIYDHWEQPYQGMKAEEGRRLTQLAEEKARIKNNT